MSKDRTPVQPKPSASWQLKAALGMGRGSKRHQRADGRSLKQRVVAIMAGRDQADEELKELCGRWLFNKHADPAKPPLHLGCTRKKKSKSSGSAAPKK